MNTPEITAGEVGRFALFAGVPESDLVPLAEHAVRRELSDNEVLFQQGQPAGWLFLVVSGQVLLRSAFEGRSVIVQTVGPGEILGWAALRDGASWLTTGRALGQLEVIAIPTDRMLDLLTASSHARELLRRLFGVAADHLDHLHIQLHRVGREGVITAG